MLVHFATWLEAPYQTTLNAVLHVSHAYTDEVCKMVGVTTSNSAHHMMQVSLVMTLSGAKRRSGQS